MKKYIYIVVVILGLILFGCTQINNTDIEGFLNQLNTINLQKPYTEKIKIDHDSDWDVILISMAYLGTDEILKLVDIDEKSVRLLEKISMSSEWPHMFLIKENFQSGLTLLLL